MTAPALSSVEPQPSALFFGALYDGRSGVEELRTFVPDGESRDAKKLQREANRLRDFVSVTDGALDEKHIATFIEGCTAARLGAFFGVALRSRESLKTRKGNAAHCQTLTALFVDADFKHLGEAETRRRIADCPLAPSLVVESGGGLHSVLVTGAAVLPEKRNGRGEALAPSRRGVRCRCRRRVGERTCARPPNPRQLQFQT